MLPSILIILVVVCVLGYKASKRGRKLNSAIDNLEDIKSSVEINKINKEANNLLTSTNKTKQDDNGNINE